MRRRHRWLVRALTALYPGWLRRECGEDIAQSYRDLLTLGDPKGRRGGRLVAWLIRDAVGTAMKARLSGRPKSQGSYRIHDDEGDGMGRKMMTELRHAVRSVARSPGFAVVAVLTMGVGIGLNSAVFGVVHSVLLRPLPYADADELVRVDNRYLPSGSTGWVSGAEYWEFRSVAATFDATVPITPDAANLTGMPTPLRVEGMRVAPGFFEMLGVQPALGRGFLPEEGAPGGEPVIVLGHGLWTTAFGADPDVLGRTVLLNGVSRRVVGVAGPDYTPVSGYLFTGRPEEYYVPVVLDPATFDAQSVERHNLMILGRLADGVEPPEAERRMVEAVRRLEESYPGISSAGSRDVAVTRIHEAVVRPFRATLLLLTAAAGLVLFVACINVANLLLARADTRTAEIAVRAAMGAGRGRLVWNGIAESLVVGVAGGMLGLALAIWTRGALSELVPSQTPIPEGIVLGAPVVLFTIGIAAVGGVLAGFWPALQVRRGDLFDAIKAGGSKERPGRRAVLRRALAVGQIAGAVVLITSAALLVRSLGALRSVDAGFTAENLYGMQVSATRASYPEPADVLELYRVIEDRVAEIPGVEWAAASWQTPLQAGMSDWPVMPRRDGESEWYSADPNLVGLDFFRAYEMEIVEGRVFEPGDTDREPAPVILNRSGATRLFGQESAVGQFVNLSFGEPVWREVVGVVEDVRGRGLAQDPTVQTYMTYGSGPFAGNPSLVLNIRGDVAVETLRREVGAIVAGIDSEIPVGPVRSMEAVIAGSLARERLLSVLLAVFAATALLLGSIGVYGVISYSVGRRTREIGLRIAVGARPREVLNLVVRQGVFLGALGVAVGVAGSVATGRLLEGFLFGVSETDVLTLLVVGAGMLVVAGVASFLPARRAASVDPLTALRE